ncbi:type II secretion system protein GspM [Neokomagataea thailandica]|uniref:type II secretion system protein GspM n=1 Tax=Neokomagataea TaxID=1223423 RepID=UPI0008345B2C|nr:MULTISPECIES: type II secretion system protein GspM [Neokomagataea]
MPQTHNNAAPNLSHLPTGQRGRLYALILAGLAVLLCVWTVQTLISTFENTQESITTQKELLARTQRLISTIPHLENSAQQARLHMAQTSPLLTAPSDDLALAQLQETVHTLTDALNLPLTSQEPLTLPRKDHFQTIALRVAFTASWPATIQFLSSLQQTHSPHLLTEDLQISAAAGIMPDDAAAHGQPVDVSLLIVALRSIRSASALSPHSSNSQNW